MIGWRELTLLSLGHGGVRHDDRAYIRGFGNSTEVNNTNSAAADHANVDGLHCGVRNLHGKERSRSGAEGRTVRGWSKCICR